MDLSELASTASLTLALGGLGSLVWTRPNRIEDRLDKMVTRQEIHASLSSFKAEIRHDLAEHRREAREDIASLRSDLTAVAGAVGATAPRPPRPDPVTLGRDR